jgi:UDP-glucose 4-epimerase
MLDHFEEDHPSVRVVRMRPALTFKRGAASEIRRLFLGPFVPSPLLRRGLVPIVPTHPNLRFQAVHSLDVGEAYRLAVTSDVRGAFNLAAEDILDGSELARLAGARAVRVPKRLLRMGADLTWRLHLQPSPPGWVDLGFGVPLMDSARARTELGWMPRRTATEALEELMRGMRERPARRRPLSPEAGGPGRAQEVRSGVGESE